MANKIVRSIKDIKEIDEQPKWTNDQNDLLSDAKDVFVRNGDKYHNLTKPIIIDGNEPEEPTKPTDPVLYDSRFIYTDWKKDGTLQIFANGDVSKDVVAQYNGNNNILPTYNTTLNYTIYSVFIKVPTVELDSVINLYDKVKKQVIYSFRLTQADIDNKTVISPEYVKGSVVGGKTVNERIKANTDAIADVNEKVDNLPTGGGGIEPYHTWEKGITPRLTIYTTGDTSATHKLQYATINYDGVYNEQTKQTEYVLEFTSGVFDLAYANVKLFSQATGFTVYETIFNQANLNDTNPSSPEYIKGNVSGGKTLNERVDALTSALAKVDVFKDERIITQLTSVQGLSSKEGYIQVTNYEKRSQSFGRFVMSKDSTGEGTASHILMTIPVADVTARFGVGSKLVTEGYQTQFYRASSDGTLIDVNPIPIPWIKKNATQVYELSMSASQKFKTDDVLVFSSNIPSVQP